MGWHAKKVERSQIVGLWEMFTVKWKNSFCKNQNKKNLLIRKMCTKSTFFKLVNFFLINKVLKVVP